MVFGFGKKKTVEEPVAPAKKEREVSLQDIPSIIMELETPRISKALDEARQLKASVESAQKSIYELILHLESDDLKLDDVDKNLKTIGKRGKDAVVSTIKKETKAKLASVEKYEDIVELNGEVNQILKRMGDVLGLHTRVLHVFARKYADKLKEEISKLAQNRNSLQRLISEHEKFRADVDSITEIIKNIEALREDKRQKAHRVNEIIKEKADTTQNISRLSQEIGEAKSRPEHNEFLQVKKEIDLVSNEEHDIKGRINAQFTKISRPLNKYSDVSSFDKPMKKLMDEMIADPYKALSTENKGPITEILQAVTKSVVAGNVSVKDSDRSAELVEETIERIDEFIGLKTDYLKKVSNLESKLGIFDSKKLEVMEMELEKARLNLADLDASRQKLEHEINENHIKLGSLRQELEKKISLLSNEQIVARIQA